MSKHTKGPWFCVEGARIYSALGADSGDGCKADLNDGWHIASVGDCTTSVEGLGEVELGYQVKLANAHLIAAAPELLEALEAAMKFIDSHVADPDITQEMASAWYQLNKLDPEGVIAKAKGESK